MNKTHNVLDGNKFCEVNQGKMSVWHSNSMFKKNLKKVIVKASSEIQQRCVLNIHSLKIQNIFE